MQLHTVKIICAYVFTLMLLFGIPPLKAGPIIIPKSPNIAGTAFILQDYHSDHIISSKSTNLAIEPASITKMMTAYIVFSELKEGKITLADKVLISKKAWKMEGSRMYIEVGKQVSVEKLLKGLIIQSGNDAAVALAEHVAGDEDTFATLMNHYAEILGMNNSHFVNSTGLPDPEHMMSVKDIATLAKALIRDFPEHYKWHSIKEYTYNNITQKNRNRLLWRDKSVDGIKTGHTESAGYCLVTSAERDGMRLISVVVGAKSDNARTKESQKLLNFGFRFYETHLLYSAFKSIKSTRVWKGTQPQLDLGLAEDLYITIPSGQYKNIDANLNLQPTLFAPIKQNSPYGSVSLSLGGNPVAERPLIALQDIPEGSLWQRINDEVSLFFEGLFSSNE